MDDDLWLLGPEGDRLDAFAAMHGVVASCALAAVRRRAQGSLTRRQGRQARGLIAVATALARAFRQGDEADIEAVAAAIGRAAAFERGGVPHDRLVAMPPSWPFKGLRINNPAAVALVAIMRLRQALQDRLMAAESPRRATQLRVIRDLEDDLFAIARDSDRHLISTAVALRRVRARFAVAEPAIGMDLAELLGGAEAIVEAVIATIGTDARPAA